MILGMSTSTFTLLHVGLSLVGIIAGLIVLAGMFGSRKLEGWTAIFLGTTVLTSASGFLFPRDQILPSHVVGILSLITLAVAVYALYFRQLAARWRWIYIVTAAIAFYLNVFVGIFQSFLKVPALLAMAPTQSEPPFVIAQAIALAIFIGATVLAVKSFHPARAVAPVQLKTV
jgi:hypothetical protein